MCLGLTTRVCTASKTTLRLIVPRFLVLIRAREYYELLDDVLNVCEGITFRGTAVLLANVQPVRGDITLQFVMEGLS